MNTDQLERDMNELCHKWMHGETTTDGVFGPVQAAARVFLTLSAWTCWSQPGRPSSWRPISRPGCAGSSDPRRRGAARAAGLQREGVDPEALIAPRL